MANDGKRLEALVAFVEETLVPPGFTVDPRQKVFEDGVQMAEFDVVVEGMVGTAKIRWLIQCRDRPSEGSAPGHWIDELKARSARFGFDKVTAVSTTGFSPDAVNASRAHGIELRSATSVSPTAFAWLQAAPLQNTKRICECLDARLLIDEKSSPEIIAAVRDALKGNKPDVPVLTKKTTGELVSPLSALLYAVEQQGLFEPLPANGPGIKLNLNARYTNDADHFVIETALGPVRVEAIEFKAHLRVEHQEALPQAAVCYGRPGEDPISEVVTYAPVDIQGSAMALELHKVGDSGIHVLLRNQGKIEGR